MKKLKPTTSLKAGDIVHIRTRVEKHHKHEKQVLTFGRIERIMEDDLCLVSYVEKINGSWKVIVNDVPFKVSELKQHPNQQLVKLVQEDLHNETTAEVVDRWLSGNKNDTGTI